MSIDVEYFKIERSIDKHYVCVWVGVELNLTQDLNMELKLNLHLKLNLRPDQKAESEEPKDWTLRLKLVHDLKLHLKDLKKRILFDGNLRIDSWKKVRNRSCLGTAWDAWKSVDCNWWSRNYLEWTPFSTNYPTGSVGNFRHFLLRLRLDLFLFLLLFQFLFLLFLTFFVGFIRYELIREVTWGVRKIG